MGKVKDETGNTYGRLTVISKSDKTDSANNTYWNCECECGNKVVVSGYKLRRGHTKSCGCYNRDCAKARCGENHPSWKPELTDEERRDKRNSSEARRWKRQVKKDANYTCDCCHQKGRKVTRSSFGWLQMVQGKTNRCFKWSLSMRTMS